jgi:hypothetical protein
MHNSASSWSFRKCNNESETPSNQETILSAAVNRRFFGVTCSIFDAARTSFAENLDLVITISLSPLLERRHEYECGSAPGFPTAASIRNKTPFASQCQWLPQLSVDSLCFRTSDFGESVCWTPQYSDDIRVQVESDEPQGEHDQYHDPRVMRISVSTSRYQILKLEFWWTGGCLAWLSCTIRKTNANLLSQELQLPSDLQASL